MRPCRTLPPIFKAGDTFSAGGQVTGISADMLASATLNDPLNGNAKVADLQVTLDTFVDLVTPRAILIESTTSTAGWPTGELNGDIKFVGADGVTIHSLTFVVPVLRAETT